MIENKIGPYSSRETAEFEARWLEGRGAKEMRILPEGNKFWLVFLFPEGKKLWMD